MRTQQLETIQIPKQEAHEKWKECIAAAKKDNTRNIKDLQKVYYHLKSGKKVLDIFVIFKKFGLNNEGDPKLAICKADALICRATKEIDGSIRFKDDDRSWSYQRDDVVMPKGTYNFKTKKNQYPSGFVSETVLRRDIKAPVPIVPADKMPDSKLENFYILWDVDKWELAPPKDPILLRKLTKNLFLIEAKWNLTKLERAVIRGRLE